MDAQALLTLLLGSGGALFVGALFTGIKSIQSGASQKTRESVADLAKWRAEADDRRERAEAERDEALSRVNCWRAYAGSLEYSLTQSGQPVPTHIQRPMD